MAPCPRAGSTKIVPLQTVTTTLTPNKDSSIFAEDILLARDFADGQGFLYTGVTGSTWGPYVRRALVSFDLSSVPTNAVIQSAQLKVTIIQNGADADSTAVEVHRLTETWGEGPSINTIGGYGAAAGTNDATWRYRFYNTSLWSTQGGSFDGTASATTLVSGNILTWSTTTLKSDVQGWVTTPASNAGWMIGGNPTTENTPLSALQLSSMQQGGAPPELTITYDAPPQPTHFEQWVATYYPNPNNIAGRYINPGGDDDGDSIFNQVEYSFGFSPVSKDAMSDGFDVTTSPNGSGGTYFTITFRRDPLATDLTYQLQTSGDLSSWTTIAQSVGGAMATGSGLVSDDENDLDSAFRTVTAEENLPGPASAHHRFARLKILRSAP